MPLLLFSAYHAGTLLLSISPIIPHSSLRCSLSCSSLVSPASSRSSRFRRTRPISSNHNHRLSAASYSSLLTPHLPHVSVSFEHIATILICRCSLFPLQTRPDNCCLAELSCVVQEMEAAGYAQSSVNQVRQPTKVWSLLIRRLLCPFVRTALAQLRCSQSIFRWLDGWPLPLETLSQSSYE